MREALIPGSSSRDAGGRDEDAGAAAWDAPALRGRQRELESVWRLFREASAGRGGALVLRGEAGIGKSALISVALRNVSGVQVLRTAGAEFEMQLPFAALHHLCAPVLDRVSALPPRQRAALEAAFGMRDEGPPDRLLVGLAVLGLLSECGEREPVICVIDDAQWLDEASAHAVAFAARRIESEQVAILFSMRETNGAPELAGFPDLWLEGLGDEDARLLLASEIHAPMDHRVRDRIIAEARGNPLALLELPRSTGPLEVAGGFAVPKMRQTASRIEESFVQRLSGLPHETQLLLVVAAAEPLADPTLLWDALHRMGIASQAAAPAEAAGLFEVGQRVRFRHPLVRSAVYRAAAPDDRRRAHRALADATDPARDPDRRAWHRAPAALGPDEQIAAQLERSASRAQARGGAGRSRCLD